MYEKGIMGNCTSGKTNMWLEVTDINALNNILINDFY